MTAAEICNEKLDNAMNRNQDTTRFIEDLHLSSPEVNSLVQRLLFLEDENVRLNKQLALWLGIKRGFSPLLRFWNFLKSIVPILKVGIKDRHNSQELPTLEAPKSTALPDSFVEELLKGRVVLLVWAPRNSQIWRGDYSARLFGSESCFLSVSQEAKRHRVHVISPQTPWEVSQAIGRYLDVESKPSRAGLIQTLNSTLWKR